MVPPRICHELGTRELELGVERAPDPVARRDVVPQRDVAPCDPRIGLAAAHLRV